MTRSPKGHVCDPLKIFAQKLTWRNGQDTAYNVRVIADRLNQKLKVLNILQKNTPENKTRGSHRTTYYGSTNKHTNSFFEAIRTSKQESAPKMQNFNYERRLRFFLVEHMNRMSEMVNQKDWQLLIESMLTRDSRTVPHRVLLQLLAAV